MQLFTATLGSAARALRQKAPAITQAAKDIRTFATSTRRSNTLPTSYDFSRQRWTWPNINRAAMYVASYSPPRPDADLDDVIDAGRSTVVPDEGENYAQWLARMQESGQTDFANIENLFMSEDDRLKNEENMTVAHDGNLFLGVTWEKNENGEREPQRWIGKRFPDTHLDKLGVTREVAVPQIASELGEADHFPQTRVDRNKDGSYMVWRRYIEAVPSQFALEDPAWLGNITLESLVRQAFRDAVLFMKLDCKPGNLLVTQHEGVTSRIVRKGLVPIDQEYAFLAPDQMKTINVRNFWGPGQDWVEGDPLPGSLPWRQEMSNSLGKEAFARQQLSSGNVYYQLALERAEQLVPDGVHDKQEAAIERVLNTEIEPRILTLLVKNNHHINWLAYQGLGGQVRESTLGRRSDNMTGRTFFYTRQEIESGELNHQRIRDAVLPFVAKKEPVTFGMALTGVYEPPAA